MTKVSPFTYDTPFKQNLNLADAARNAKKTVLIFHRYIGCSNCQLILWNLIQSYEQFIAKDAKALVVIQSTPERVKGYYSKDQLPFDVICDPEMKLYDQFEIDSRTCVEELYRPCDTEKRAVLRAEAAGHGFVHGEFEGNEYQLPAFYILDSDLNVLYHHQSASLADMPSPSEIAALL